MMTEEERKSLSQSYDINNSNFNPDLYLQKLLKENSLKDIMEEEERIVKDTQSLHSEMQTLVYENYNKFISATDTIKKMKSDFKQMETEMDLLATNMNSITSFSDQIANTLQDSRQKISKLSNVHSLLKRLQFLYTFPSKLKQLMDEGNHAQAVADYVHTQQVLDHYTHLESFHGIQKDCLKIVQELKNILRSKFKDKECSAKDVTGSVELLLQLSEPVDSLYSEIISHASHRLSDQLAYISLDCTGQDLIEFVDIVNSGYLSDLCHFVSSYNGMFASYPEHCDAACERLEVFVSARVAELMSCLDKRFQKEVDNGADCAVLVRALDRLHSTLLSVGTHFTSVDLHRESVMLVGGVAERECKATLARLENHVTDSVRSVRQALAQGAQTQSPPDTSELLASLVLSTLEKVKGALHDLKMFVSREVSFFNEAELSKELRLEMVYRGLVVELQQWLTQFCLGFLSAPSVPSAPSLLVLAKMCLEFESSHTNYLLNLTSEWFEINDVRRVSADKELVCALMRDTAQKLVNHYVKLQGQLISQMVRKSVETRDWEHCMEPRTPRAVVKRVLEEVSAADSAVGRLFDMMAPPPPSSDSSRHRSHHSRPWSTHSHHINKIFSEKIDIFSPVQFDKASILTGIIKLSLKTLLECVRLKTFNKFGLQQIQVDTHYLQLYLWRYVSDESIVHLLLDEILGSAVHRCLQPVLMEPSVVEILCERG